MRHSAENLSVVAEILLLEALQGQLFAKLQSSCMLGEDGFRLPQEDLIGNRAILNGWEEAITCPLPSLRLSACSHRWSHATA